MFVSKVCAYTVHTVITCTIDNIDYVHGIGNWRNFSPFPVRGRVAAEAIPEVEIEEGRAIALARYDL